MVVRNYHTVRNRFYEKGCHTGAIYPTLAGYDREFLDWLAEQTAGGEASLVSVLASIAYDTFVEERESDDRTAAAA